MTQLAALGGGTQDPLWGEEAEQLWTVGKLPLLDASEAKLNDLKQCRNGYAKITMILAINHDGVAIIFLNCSIQSR